MSDEPRESKLHVDSDWKAEAEQEKQRLAAEEQQAAAQHPAGPLPDPTLVDLINVIATPAVMSIGGYRLPDGKVVPPDLNQAKYHIDLLGLLEEKTRGNVSDEEGQTLAAVLHHLRMQFAEAVAGGSGTKTPPPPTP